MSIRGEKAMYKGYITDAGIEVAAQDNKGGTAVRWL